MRVLLATGIFYPDVGGPATHVRKIAEHFSGLGWSVTVVAFGERLSDETVPYRVVRTSRHMPKLLSWLMYAFTVVREAARSDIVYAFDLTTAGMPAALSAALWRKRLIVRIGGDPIWEREAEAGRRLIPMDEYYAQGLHMQDRPQLYRVLRHVVRSADRIVVYNQRFKDFYVRYFGANPSNVTVVKNPVLPKETPSRESGTRTCIFAGRFVAYKNLRRVIEAAAKSFPKHPTARLLFVGDGPEREALETLAKQLGVPLTIRPKTDQASLFHMIRASSVALAPAFSEFNPNFILESLSLGKPVLISKGHGLSLDVPDMMEFDPMDVDSLEGAFDRILSDDGYSKAEAAVQSLPLDWTWRDVLTAQETIVRDTV
ncbi:MAG: glycosyltransferase family 4 protein [Minisyncoccota bacterium]